VVKVWFRCVEYIQNEKTQPDALKIMSARVGLKPEEYKPLLGGTFLLDLPGNLKALEQGPGLDSVYGSSAMVDKFNVSKGVYKEAQDAKSYLDPSLVKALK
jgi:NitT/TauT family transport system substrate-binding protein